MSFFSLSLHLLLFTSHLLLWFFFLKFFFFVSFHLFLFHSYACILKYLYRPTERLTRLAIIELFICVYIMCIECERSEIAVALVSFVFFFSSLLSFFLCLSYLTFYPDRWWWWFWPYSWIPRTLNFFPFSLIFLFSFPLKSYDSQDILNSTWQTFVSSNEIVRQFCRKKSKSKWN